MLVNLLSGLQSDLQTGAAAMIAAALLTFITLNCRFGFLPRDKGRDFAVNGALSRGKLRGTGLVIVVCFLLVSLLFVRITPENLIFDVLMLAVMLSGYLDDASEVSWSDYKKGLIDLVISVAYMVCFVSWNSTEIHFLSASLTLPRPVYVLLGIMLIWLSINVVNCSDGVDGLCGSLTGVSIASFLLIFGQVMGGYSSYTMIMIGCILAYLYFNCSPSSMLMGDAGSRAFGFFLAVLAMKSGHPFIFLLLVLVMIVDGGIGLVKIFLLRFLKIRILAHTRTPIHDELRKNRQWSDTQVVIRFVLIQILISAVAFLIL